MDDYIKLKEFWNDCFKYTNDQIYEDKEIWIIDEKVISLFKQYINTNTTVLDYGCGSGYLLPQIFQISPFKKGLGVDTSINGINFAKEIIKESGYDHIDYLLLDDETLLNKYDFIVSINVLDVLPEDIMNSILLKIKESLNQNGHIFIGLNPDYDEQFLINKIRMTKVNNYYYKDGILRANKKTIIQWQEILSNYFNIKETFSFYFTENEKEHPRVGFLLENK